MPNEVNLNGRDKVLRAILDEAERKMVKTAAWLVGYTKKSVSRGNITGESPSAPGEPPKLVKGLLASSINCAIVRSSRDVIGYVGVEKGTIAAKYGLYLELGRGPIFPVRAKLLKFKIGKQWISKHSVGPMAARPYLRPTIINNREKIKSMLGVKG